MSDEGTTDQRTGGRLHASRARASAVLVSAEQRDEHAELRDAKAEARDALAQSRDDLSTDTDQFALQTDGADHARLRAVQERRSSAQDRSDARSDRRLAAEDRVSAADDRRSLLIDALTGAHGREVGLMELEREVTLAHRRTQPYVLAFVDVDGLKEVNDTQGHAAGDRRLVESVDAIRAHLRDYDVVLRLSGDEFVCGLSDMDPPEAEQRFLLVNQRLADQRAGQVTVGLASLRPHEDLDTLIDRADAAMYQVRRRRGRRNTPPP